MACILSIETSTEVCSVAVSDAMEVVWREESAEGFHHAERLPVFVEHAIYHIGAAGLQLDAVAVSNGPGSYTGLRIGLSTAKGLCYGFGVKLIVLSTLDLLCVPVLLRENISEGALLCPMLDARRMEVYAQVCDTSLQQVRGVAADIVEEDTYKPFLDEREVYFFGNGAAKCKSIINHPNARFIDGIVPLASDMQPLADRCFREGAFADVAYSVPFYLKEYHTTVAKRLL